ncbi:MAG: hypothetical protein HRT61_16415 [Ekhidna sp.]|nr:hypothetical protein [Ekhidna sp.]
MEYTINRCKSDGVYFRPWAERVIELCEGEGLVPPEHRELDKLYREDFYYEDALLYARFKTTKLVWMELHVKSESGVHIERFRTSYQARDFFFKFPKLREYLEK